MPGSRVGDSGTQTLLALRFTNLACQAQVFSVFALQRELRHFGDRLAASVAGTLSVFFHRLYSRGTGIRLARPVIIRSLMAAYVEWPEPRVVELRRISAEDLEPVLTEELAVWRRELAWDLTSSAELVRRYIRMQALSGYALVEGSRVTGYSYFVREDHKGLIGDHYILERHRTPMTEDALIHAVMANLQRMPGVHRVEAQLLLLSGGAERAMPFSNLMRAYPRWFLEIPLSNPEALLSIAPPGIRVQPWREVNFEDSAKLVVSAYRDNIDSEINDQYRSPAGARRFLSNIIEFPGCGVFFPAASYAAFDASGALCGMSLASLV